MAAGSAVPATIVGADEKRAAAIPAALYARKSADETLSPSSDTGNQVLEIQTWASENNFEIVAQYIDEGVKGWTLERPALEKLREAIRSRNKAFTAIIISAWDRLARDIGDAFLLLGELEAYNTRVISVRQGEAKDENSKLGRDLYFLLSKRENSARGGHVLAGQKRWASEGYSPGGEPPYGYRRKHVTDGKGVVRTKYEPDPEKVQTVQNIYLWYMNGFKIAEIAKKLNDLGTLPPKKGSWNALRVMRVLFRHQAKYQGIMTFNKTRFHKKFKKSTPKPPEEWISCPNAHEAIVSAEMVASVNQIYQARHGKLSP